MSANHSVEDQKKALEKLREKNAERWERLKELHHDASSQQQIGAGARSGGNGDAGAVSGDSYYQSLEAESLRLESDLLPRSECGVGADELLREIISAQARRRSRKENASQQQQQQQQRGAATARDGDVGEEDGDSTSGIGGDDRDGDLFASEVIESYNELLEINSDTENVIERELRRLDQMRLFGQELGEIGRELLEEIREEEKKRSSTHAATNGSTQQHQRDRAASAAARSHLSSLELDLRYVAEIIEEQRKREADLERHRTIQRRFPRRRRVPSSSAGAASRSTLGSTNQQEAYEAAANEEEATGNGKASTWSLDRLVRELVRLLANSPKGDKSAPRSAPLSYLSIRSHPCIQMVHVKLLRQHNIVVTSEENSDLIRLVDYRR